MKVETYVIPTMENGSVSYYEFQVVLAYPDGKITSLGQYTVDDKDNVEGLVDGDLTNDLNVFNRIKQAILDSGLFEIVGDKLSPKNYFWKQIISIPPNVSLPGAFKRASNIVKEGRCKLISSDGFFKLLRESEEMDKDPIYDNVSSYDGINGSDEFDYDDYVDSDEDEVIVGVKR